MSSKNFTEQQIREKAEYLHLTLVQSLGVRLIDFDSQPTDEKNAWLTVAEKQLEHERKLVSEIFPYDVGVNNLVDGVLKNWQQSKYPTPPIHSYSKEGLYFIGKIDPDMKINNVCTLVWHPGEKLWIPGKTNPLAIGNYGQFIKQPAQQVEFSNQFCGWVLISQISTDHIPKSINFLNTRSF